MVQCICIHDILSLFLLLSMHMSPCIICSMFCSSSQITYVYSSPLNSIFIIYLSPPLSSISPLSSTLLLGCSLKSSSLLLLFSSTSFLLSSLQFPSPIHLYSSLLLISCPFLLFSSQALLLSSSASFFSTLVFSPLSSPE